MFSLKSPAKINLHLRVLGKREDGYHEIATIFHALELADRMSFRTIDKGVRLVTTGAPLPQGRDNLVYQAAAVLVESCAPLKGVHITLEKRIPVAAGLGGGSSNAATTLSALNRLWNLGLSKNQMSDMAARLGSDVSFFLTGPAAVGRGRGELLCDIDTLGGLPLVLVVPPFHVSSAWVYSRLNLELTKPCDDISMIQTIISTKKVDHWASHLRNDLEAAVIAGYPLIEQIKGELIERGAVTALMSGSGPCVFGVFKDLRVARSAANALEKGGRRVITTRTIDDP